MNAKSQFAALEIMCRERAVARKEMESWQEEAEEWKRLGESSDPFKMGIPIQLDWCAEPSSR